MDDGAAVPKQDSRFSCNICLDPVTEPVVTQCGHLFCWPCLFRWLEPSIRPQEALPSWDYSAPAAVVDDSRRCCPVCKAECSVPTLVPIYVRNEPSTPLGSARKTPQEEQNDVQEETQDSEEKEQANDNGNDETNALEETENTNNIEEELSSPGSIHQEETGLESVENTPTGLRQRLRFRSRDSEIPEIPLDDVPSRPAANSPARPSSSSSTAIEPRRVPQVYSAARPPLSPHQVSLSHGMLLMFQQALNASDAANGSTQQQQQQQQRRVPPLHQTSGDVDAFTNNRAHAVESPRDDATEFLSRLILILASFVILCLLLF